MIYRMHMYMCFTLWVCGILPPPCCWLLSAHGCQPKINLNQTVVAQLDFRWVSSRLWHTIAISVRDSGLS